MQLLIYVSNSCATIEQKIQTAEGIEKIMSKMNSTLVKYTVNLNVFFTTPDLRAQHTLSHLHVRNKFLAVHTTLILHDLTKAIGTSVEKEYK